MFPECVGTSAAWDNDRISGEGHERWDMALAPDGRLLVSNFDSGQVEAVDVATAPGAPGAAG